MEKSYEVIIAGAGSMGMSAGYHLAKRGVRTLLLDAFDPPHASGSHHGETRLIRHAYPGAEIYTELALRSHELWRELEEESGETLLVESGVLNIALPGDHVLAEKQFNAEASGLSIELLEREEIEKRWPGWRLPEGSTGLYEPRAGYLYSERCVAASKRQALAAGAELKANTPVRRVAADGDGIAVYTDQGVYRADKVIVSAGAWFSSLSIDPPISLPIRPIRKTVGWFEADEQLFGEGRFPGFTFGSGSESYYGFPSIGGGGVKIGRHDGGVPWQPGQEWQPFGSFEADEGDIRRALERYAPQAAGRLQHGAVCKYEMTADDDFIIDAHPGLKGLWLAGGFSGHGFKFASAVGELLANLVTVGRPSTERSIAPFSLNRFGERA
ncbi:N-methyl-L-tryptophan oxidase [Paenibacillus sp. NPDC058071]|uniref:N-methyl-L-tryptophan oxidase n=1 Tax=Paenibacillus sp. NPDC058071 TaxID=3346326 RepID=UPI0036DBC643